MYLSLTPSPARSRKELHKDEANDRWLRTFCENLDKIQEARNGFVLQIQQGVVREKSHMQIAEERMGKQWSVPCIGLYAFAITHLRGGGDLAEQHLASAVEKARKQWEEGSIRAEVQMVSEWFEPIGNGELHVNEHGMVQGRARCRLPSGAVYEGDFKDNTRHGWGTSWYESGEIYEGEFQNGNRHGKGT